MLNLAKQTWLLLGASGGIGSALLEQLLAAGASVIVTSRKPAFRQGWAGRERVTQAALDLSAGNLGDEIKALLSEHGVPHGVIHCAGVNRFVGVESNHDASLDEMLNVNLRSAVILARELVPAFRVRGHGTFLFVGSTFGSIGYPGYSAYCASKFGLRGFVESLRRELADTDIRVRYAAPRATRTAMNDGEVEALNKALGNRMDTPESVAEQIVAALETKSRRASFFIGWPEKLFVRLNALLPILIDRALRKQLPTIQHYLKDRT